MKSHVVLGESFTSESQIAVGMPRVLNQKLPLEGLFGLIKPSGPPSMVLLDRIKPLLYESPLFVTEEEDRKRNRDMRLRGAKKGRGSKRRHKQNECVKVGQGGTLDPLADGVLGTTPSLPILFQSLIIVYSVLISCRPQ